MKINPPKAIIGKEDPFEHTLFRRKEFAESLTNLLRNVEENLVIFVNAPWGEGKTTFAEMWKTQLEKRDHLNVIYFDAYAADYFDDPFVSFSGEILEFADKHLPDGKKLKERREFKKTAVEVGKRLAGLAVKVGIRAATLNAFDEKHEGELKKIGDELVTGVSEISADVIEKKIEKYGEEKDALRAFKKSLEKLADKVQENQKFPLTIIVDELDRCRPDFALGLLERIKHLFDVKGVAFVLLVNRNQIENYIRTVYGGSDAESYLLKFGSLFIDLPNQGSASNSQEYQKGVKEYCHSLVSHYGFPAQTVDTHFFATSMGIFANHFGLTLREIEKAFTVAAIYFSSSTPDRFSNRSENVWLIALLSILKIKTPLIYSSLSKQTFTLDRFYQDTKLDRLNFRGEQQFNWDYLNALLEFYLMSDAELEKAAKGEGEKNGYLRQITSRGSWTQANRNNVILNHCSSLDRFSVKPQ
ncbi:MAG TPA: P-loop NTPase fold protein [Verrucomicrobiae bacterium]|nr:P-loop NTPase fold protein [Verrucomicrobiae bacterium]